MNFILYLIIRVIDNSKDRRETGRILKEYIDIAVNKLETDKPIKS